LAHYCIQIREHLNSWNAKDTMPVPSQVIVAFRIKLRLIAATV
jgi:hypothetical protein